MHKHNHNADNTTSQRSAGKQNRDSGTRDFIKQLFRDTFFKGGAYEDEMKILEGGLRTKTWIIHITLMVSRVVFSSLGQSYW